MSYYELLLFLHISSAIIWLGAGFAVAILLLGAERAGDRVRAAGHHREVGWLTPRLFIPASLSTLILGILLVLEGSWDFDQLWIVLALAGWAVSFGLGFFYFRPEGEALGELVQDRGPEDSEFVRRLGTVNIIDRVQVTILFLVVADMVLKPTGDDTGLLIAGAAILAAAVAAAALALSRIPRKAT